MSTEVSIRNTRTVTILQTKGERTVQLEIPSDVTTFGHLKEYFKNAGVHYDIQNNIAIEGAGNTTLELDSAVLPKGDFKLGIFSRKTKAGVDRKVLYSRIKEFVHRYGNQKVKEYFQREYGDSYTRIPNDKLEDLVNRYSNSTTETIEVQAIEEQGEEALTDVIELLSKMGVSDNTLASVKADLQGSPKGDLEWLRGVCASHPLLSC